VSAHTSVKTNTKRQTRDSYSKDGLHVRLVGPYGFTVLHRDGVSFAEARERGAADFAAGVPIDRDGFLLWSPRHSDEWRRGYIDAQRAALFAVPA
jgi:hypothetical protein